MPAIVKNDPWWLADPHRKAYTEQGVLGPTLPAYWAFNPAYAEVQNTHVWSAAWADIMRNGMTPEAAADEGVQADRGDLRQIPDRAKLIASRCGKADVISASDCRGKLRNSAVSGARGLSSVGNATVNGSDRVPYWPR